MLSFSKLGQFGRLGNQMFQYASLKGIAANRGFDFYIPPSVDVNPFIDHKLFSSFVLDSVSSSFDTQPMLQERFFHFDKDLFNECPDNVDLHGYFQSYKYFENIKDEIIKDFTFKNPVENPYKNYVSIHVRRGDYTFKQDSHPLCNLDYYAKAMATYEKYNFVVFSDDIGWCKEQKIFKDCLFSEQESNINDLQLMSEAEHNIIANSSLSWWAAYLNKNPNKIVICPKNWFGVNYSNYNMDDLRPTEWIQL